VANLAFPGGAPRLKMVPVDGGLTACRFNIPKWRISLISLRDFCHVKKYIPLSIVSAWL
jgi:hypothetical protein